MKTGMIGKVGSLQNPQKSQIQNEKADGKGFKEALKTQLDNVAKQSPVEKSALPQTLKFSNHAVDRMSQRGIKFTPDEMTKIEDAARKAAEKGAKETLIFTDENALIVDAKNNTIVTVMDKASMKENVFTKIDATVVL